MRRTSKAATVFEIDVKSGGLGFLDSRGWGKKRGGGEADGFLELAGMGIRLPNK